MCAVLRRRRTCTADAAFGGGIYCCLQGVDDSCGLRFQQLPAGRLSHCLRAGAGQQGEAGWPEGLFSVQQIQDASAWTHDFGDGKGEIRGAYGSHFIRLKTPGHRGIGIHGTHDPASIGTRATEGCVRLNNSDLLELVKKYVYVGMPVVILTSEADSAVPCRFPAAVKAGPRLMAQTE